MKATQKTPPSSEPVLISEARNHLKDPPSTDDPLIESLITAAREHIESCTRRVLMSQIWEYRIDGAFPDIIELPNPPLQSVSSIQYLDTSGTLQTLAPTEYEVDIHGVKGSVQEAYGKTWPSVREQVNSIIITFACGYSDETAVPEPIKIAMYLLIAHWYENRQAITLSNMKETPLGVKSLLWPYRVLDL